MRIKKRENAQRMKTQAKMIPHQVPSKNLSELEIQVKKIDPEFSGKRAGK